MSRQSAGVTLAVNHAERALKRATDAGTDTEERLSAVIEAVWWVGAGWDAAGRPDSRADAVLLGFWWVRNRSIHDVTMLVGKPEAYAGSPPTIRRSPGVNTGDAIVSEVWGSMDEIKWSLTGDDFSKPQHRVAYASALEGNQVGDTIREGLTRLRTLGGRTERGLTKGEVEPSRGHHRSVN